MKQGDIVKEKITGWEVVLIRPYSRFWKLFDDYDWDAKVWVKNSNGTGYWEYMAYKESELTTKD